MAGKKEDPYLNLLKNTLIDHRSMGSYEYHPLKIVEPNWKTWPLFLLDLLLQPFNFAITKKKLVDPIRRSNGYDWPANALTMIGRNRLDNIQELVTSTLNDRIQGDLMEAGVWRGGASIFMRALLEHFGEPEKKVWIADSFEGCPRSDVKAHPADRGSDLYRKKILNVPLQEVQRNFQTFGLLDDRVRVLHGWFDSTLPDAPIDQLSLLRVDCDLYSSTKQVILNMYPKLSVGGYIIIDDYNSIPGCKKAVDDMREFHNITTPIIPIDLEAIYWRKE